MILFGKCGSMHKILINILNKLGGYAGKRFLVLPKKTFLDTSMGAVFSRNGFWYVGNLFDTNDIAYGIARNGEVESEETQLVITVLTKMLRNENALNFYDIGANTGYYGILAANLGSGRVNAYSFEPINEYVENIKTSVYLNRFEEFVKVFECGIGNEDGTTTLHMAGSGSTVNHAFIDNQAVPQRKISLFRLDTFRANRQLPVPHFIKIDVEGYEFSVLEGSQKTLADCTPVLFIEIAKTMKNIGREFNNLNFGKTFNLLAGLGYEAWTVLESGVQKTKPGEIHDGVKMYLFVPKKYLYVMGVGHD